MPEATPARQPKYTMTLQDYARTLEGRRMILEQTRFAIAGRIFQGYNGAATYVDLKQLEEWEIDKVIDIDGKSLDEIRKKKAQHKMGRTIMKDRELAERRSLKITAQKDELHLQVLQHQAAEISGKAAQVFATPEEERAFLKSRLAELDAPSAETGTGEFTCPTCDKGPFETQRALNGHMGGAHPK